MDSAGVERERGSFDTNAPARARFLPTAVEDGQPETAIGPPPTDEIARLRVESRSLAEELDAIDRRDAAQHGGLKDELAHLVRPIARLEAIPRPRPVR